MADMDVVAVGDEVIEFEANGTWRGRVVKIGRSLIHIQGKSGGQIRKYRRADHHRHDSIYGGGFRTLARQADLQRRTEAQRRIRDHGLTWARDFDRTTDGWVELADAIDKALGRLS